MTKVAVVLSGCGVFDGSEIHEAVLTLLHLDRLDVAYQCIAPDIPQMHVIDHSKGEPVAGEQRNVLVEAARIARGEILDLAEASAAEFDALILPGGFGAAKNLSDFAVQGAECAVLPDLVRFAREFQQAGKPVGLICIAPALAPRIFGEGVEVTIGSSPETAAAIEAMGGVHQLCPVEAIHIDTARKLVTTPAYMLAGRIREADAGIGRLVEEVVALAR